MSNEGRDDPFDIAGQEQAAKERELYARLERESEESDFRWLMNSRRGRRIVWRLLEQSGVFRSSYSPTAMQMAFNEGHRNYGNRTLALIHQYCAELYSIMVKENTNARRDTAGQDASRDKHQ